MQDRERVDGRLKNILGGLTSGKIMKRRRERERTPFSILGFKRLKEALSPPKEPPFLVRNNIGF
jgi:hypothetical protein